MGPRDTEHEHGKPNTCGGFSLPFLACLAAGAILRELEVNFFGFRSNWLEQPCQEVRDC